MKIHTPGPWEIQQKTRPTIYLCSKKGHWSNMIKVSCSPSRKEEAEANARLIAAAPDLLEATQRAIYWLKGENPPTVDKVNILWNLENALSKAKGGKLN